MTSEERFNEMLRGRGLSIGDQVVCQYRTPDRLQYWIHPFWVGVIEAPSAEPHSFGRRSEADYCTSYYCVKVRYLGHGTMAGFTQFDQLAYLTPLIGEPVAESPWFASDDIRALQLFASRVGMAYSR